MRKSVSMLAVIAATLMVSSAPAQERATPANIARTEESAKKVKELRKERIAVLKKLTDQLTILFKNATVPYDEVLESMQSLSEAELEIAETDKERVELYKKLIDALKQREAVAEAQWKAARATETSVLKWRAKRLVAEIHLEQAKLKVANAAK